ncbi:MAG: hypothetical protein Q8Q23_01405 [bacterium]|nr:hypothetical protein [bacterium]
MPEKFNVENVNQEEERDEQDKKIEKETARLVKSFDSHYAGVGYTDSLDLPDRIDNWSNRVAGEREKYEREAIANAAIHAVLLDIEQREGNNVERILSGLELSPDSILQNAEVIEAVKEVIPHKLYDLQKVRKLITLVHLPDNCLQSPEMQTAAEKELLHLLPRKQGIESAQALIKMFQMPAERVRSVAIKVVNTLLADDLYQPQHPWNENPATCINELQEVFGISEADFRLPEQLPALVHKALLILQPGGYCRGFFDHARQLIRTHNIDLAVSQEWTVLAEQGIENLLQSTINEDYNLQEVTSVMNFMHEINMTVNIERIQQLLHKQIVTECRNASPKYARQRAAFARAQGISLDEDDIFQEVLNNVNEAFAVTMMEQVGVMNYEKLSQPVQLVINRVIEQYLKEGKFKSAVNAKEGLRVPEHLFREATHKVLSNNLYEDAFRNKSVDLDKVKKMADELNISEEEVLATTKTAVMQCLSSGYIDSALAIKEQCNIPDEVINSPDIQAAALEGIGFVLQIVGNDIEKNIKLAIEIKSKFNIPNAFMREKIQEVLDKCEEEKTYLQAVQVILEVPGLVDTAQRDRIYAQAVEQEINADDQLRQSYETLQKFLGEKKVKQLLLTHPQFWQNVHDNLLFMERITALPEDKQEKVGRLVLPLLNSQTDFKQLNELLGSFNVDIYINKHENEESPFKNFAEFEREAMMQKHHIAVPEQASDEFKEAVTTLIQAPGVDVPFIRQMIDRYNTQLPRDKEQGRKQDDVSREETWVFIDGRPLSQLELAEYRGEANEEEIGEREDEYDDEHNDDEDEEDNMDHAEFADRLINIIEGKDNIDKRQIIKPFAVEMPFDPLNKLTYTAVGIHALNSQTLQYVELFEKKETMRKLIDILTALDKEVKTELLEKKNRQTKAEPEKKDRYAADYKKALETTTLLKTGEGKKIEGVKPQSMDNALLRLDEAKQRALAEAVRECVEDDEARAVLLQTCLTFSQKGEKVFDSIDLVPFTAAIERAQTVIGDYQKYEAELTRLTEQKREELQREKSGVELTREEKSATFRAAQTEKTNNITTDKIMGAFANRELELAALMVYLGYNNRKRRSESANIKKALDKVLKQNKYVTQNDDLKKKGLIANNADAFLSYLNGQLEVEETDQELIRDILKQYGYADMGRMLKAEVAKKSDPRGWVCGDKTNCCMPLTSSKNKEYALREDMAYFIVSIVDEDGSEDLVAQSVLVAADKKEKKSKNKIDKEQEEEKQVKKVFTITDADEIAIDNIEIANRAVKYRPIIAQAYEELKKRFPDKKIVIGTSYNDDGGTVTGSCELKPVDADPLYGDMEYSDWHSHNANYVYHDPQKEEAKGERYFGLQIDMLNTSHVKQFVINKDEYQIIETVLEKIGKGEDDGDGGLNFPDNYSCVIGTKADCKGYIIAADYLKEEGEDDYIEFEKIHLRDDLSAAEKQQIFTDYLKSRRIKKSKDIDGLLLKPEVAEQAFVESALREYFSNKVSNNKAEIIKEKNGGIKVTF